MTQSVSTNFGPHFAPSPAPVAQWIERRFPKPQVACSIHAGGTNATPRTRDVRNAITRSGIVNTVPRTPTTLRLMVEYVTSVACLFCNSVKTNK